MRYITLDPYIPWALWVPLAAAAAALLMWYAVAGRSRLSRRRWVAVVTLMAIAIAVPLAILLNPTWLERIPPPAGKPLLTILVDHSASMGTRDVEGDQIRYQQAVRLAAETVRELEGRYEIRVRCFAADWSPATPEQLHQGEPTGTFTDLAAAIEDALGEDRSQGQAILLLSDGIHNAGGGTARVLQSAAKAKAMAAPVYAMTFGGQTGVRDLEVTLKQPQELAFVGGRVPVVVTVHQHGPLAGRTTLSLLYKGEVLEQRDVKLVANGQTEEVFQVMQETSGLYRYEIRAEGLPEEVTEVNNTAVLQVRVVDEPVRVLLLEGKPYWDTKFLIRTLSRDRSVELVSVVQLAEGRFLKRTVSRPAADNPDRNQDGKAAGADPSGAGSSPEGGAEEENRPPGAVRTDDWSIETDADKILSDPESLATYQIVVLGRNAEVFLSDGALAVLKKWLGEGDGSLVCFRGPPASQISQRLGELMPVRWSPVGESHFRVQLTKAGQALRWLPSSGEREDVLAGLPSLASTARAERPKLLAKVLATTVSGEDGRQIPVITYQPVGIGRVVVVEGAGMWRWAFLSPEYRQHDEVYGLLWRSLIRWLVANVGLLPSQQLALRTDKVTFSTTERPTATLLIREDRLEGEAPQIELTGGSLKEPQTFRPVPSGNYPGQFRVVFDRPLGEPLDEGQYRARVLGAGDEEISAVAAFDVRDNLQERLDVRSRPDVMQRVTEKSGGAVLKHAEPRLLAEKFEQHLSRSRPERTVQTTAWDRWWVLLAAFAIWGSAWGKRRWSGLV